MENLLISLNTVLYMLLIMGIGRASFSKLPDRQRVIAQVNKLVFKLFLPAMVFQNIYTTDLKTAFDGALLAYLLVILAVMWLLLMVLVPCFLTDRRTCGAFIQGCLRSNSIIFGLPLIAGLFPGQDLGCPTILTAITTVVFNVIGIITLEFFRGNKPDPRTILRNLSRNPVLLASLAAIALVALRLSLPEFLAKTVGAMAGMASPMGLLLIGASLQFQKQAHNRALWISLFLRLFLIPAISLLGAALLGWHGLELCTVLIIMAAPTSVSAYSMAQVMDSDSTFAANQVGLGSILGAGTVFLWTVLLNAFTLL